MFLEELLAWRVKHAVNSTSHQYEESYLVYLKSQSDRMLWDFRDSKDHLVSIPVPRTGPPSLRFWWAESCSECVSQDVRGVLSTHCVWEASIDSCQEHAAGQQFPVQSLSLVFAAVRWQRCNFPTVFRWPTFSVVRINSPRDCTNRRNKKARC